MNGRAGLTNWRAALVSTFGLGYAPFASGTWGSLPPPAIAVLVVLIAGPGLAVELAMLAMLAVFSVICVALGSWSEQHYGRKDPGEVVADETAGQALVLLALPWQAMHDAAGWHATGWAWNIALAAVAFLTFRAFDIVKPPPARNLERWPAGWGILVDDLIAALYAVLATQLFARLVLPLILG